MRRSSENRLARFIAHEATGGFALVAAAVLAMLLVNLGFGDAYSGLLEERVRIGVGSLTLDKSLHHFINDGLMAVFFFLVGLEIKREALEGNLASTSQILLPAVSALGGIVVPAAMFAAVNWNSPATLSGWAIPTATDIAFALGALALLGNRAPLSLKIFLLTLATFDDLAAIVIIGVFYTSQVSLVSLAGASLCAVCLFVYNRWGGARTAIYILVGMLMWVFVLKSGVHATLAGVVTGLLVPLRRRDGTSPIAELEHGLHPYVKWFILPFFAFANAGLPLAGLSFEALMQPLPLGILLGLALGKPVGIMLAAGLAIGLGFARLPEQTNWRYMLGVSFLAGIGFTMSLFIGSLGFGTDRELDQVRLGVMCGSVISVLVGLAIMWKGRFERP